MKASRIYMILAIVATTAIVAIAIVVVGPKFGIGGEPKEVHPAVRQFLDDPAYDGSKVKILSEEWIASNRPNLYESASKDGKETITGIFISYGHTIYYMIPKGDGTYILDRFANNEKDASTQWIGKDLQSLSPLAAEQQFNKLFGIE